MSWLKRTGKSKESDFLAAMLPEWFEESMRAGTPKAQMLEKLRTFFMQAEREYADGAPDPTPPDADFVENMYVMYHDIYQQLHGAA